ncbi:hypothetical protein AHAS_Ahas01G0033900 [Arachis hypogaea]
MLAAFVKRWRPETHTFVMPVGEVTVTLEDVLHLFGLLIDGEVVTSWTDNLVIQSLAIFDSEPQASSEPSPRTTMAKFGFLLYQAGLDKPVAPTSVILALCMERLWLGFINKVIDSSGDSVTPNCRND